jgi:hypothetical protein
MKRLVLTAAVIAQLFAGTSALHAQEAGETPVTPSELTPAPVVPPKKPADATESYDANAVQQLLTISKNTSDTFIRLDDLLKSNGLVQTVLGNVRQVTEDTQATLDTALTGVKTVPMNDTADDAVARSDTGSMRALAVQMMGGGAPALAAIATIMAEIRTGFSIDTVFENAQSGEIEDIIVANSAGHALAGMVVGEASYASANASMLRLNGYIAALGTSPDLKTSIDLNTRVMIELTQQTNEAVRTNSATTMLIAAYMTGSLGTPNKDELMKFFRNANRN